MPSASCARGPPLQDGEGPVQTRVADRVGPEAVSRDTGDGAGRAGLRPRPSWGRTGWVERRPGTIAGGAAGRGRVGFRPRRETWARRVDLAAPHEAAARAGLPKGSPSRATGGSWPDPEARSLPARHPPAGPVRSGAVARGAPKRPRRAPDRTARPPPSTSGEGARSKGRHSVGGAEVSNATAADFALVDAVEVASAGRRFLSSLPRPRPRTPLPDLGVTRRAVWRSGGRRAMSAGAALASSSRPCQTLCTLRPRPGRSCAGGLSRGSPQAGLGTGREHPRRWIDDIEEPRSE